MPPKLIPLEQIEILVRLLIATSTSSSEEDEKVVSLIVEQFKLREAEILRLTLESAGQYGVHMELLKDGD